MTYVAAARVETCPFPEPKLASRFGLFFTGPVSADEYAIVVEPGLLENVFPK